MRMAMVQKLLLTLLTVVVFAQEPKPVAQIFQTGEFHGEEVSAKTGEQWLALIPRSTYLADLSLVSVRVDPVQDAILDKDDEQSGKRVSFDNNLQQGIFLFRNIPGIRPGQIKTITSFQDIRPNEPVNLTLKSGAKYTLTLICPPRRKVATNERQTAFLVLKRGKFRQTLARYSFPYVDSQIEPGSSGSVRLYWAGDLQQNGCLSFIVDLSEGENGSSPTLFLSSNAGSKTLVFLVAEFSTIGC